MKMLSSSAQMSLRGSLQWLFFFVQTHKIHLLVPQKRKDWILRSFALWVNSLDLFFPIGFVLYPGLCTTFVNGSSSSVGTWNGREFQSRCLRGDYLLVKSKRVWIRNNGDFTFKSLIQEVSAGDNLYTLCILKFKLLVNKMTYPNYEYDYHMHYVCSSLDKKDLS